MEKKLPHTCVTPSGFRFVIHKPSYTVRNFREKDHIEPLGHFSDNSQHLNTCNFPHKDVSVTDADWVYEIPNPFSFRGTTFITKSWAESKVDNPSAIALPPGKPASLCKALGTLGHTLQTINDRIDVFSKFPEPVLLAMAANSTDLDDLTALAQICCKFTFDENMDPVGLLYTKSSSSHTPVIANHALFEIVVNNPHLPDQYKEVMVLRPGVQGSSEIIGEWQSGSSHIFEYLRRNSYIPWGHYAANMANDSIRYHANELSESDITGLRHLYYQRTYTRIAEFLNLEIPQTRQRLSEDDLEVLRINILSRLKEDDSTELPFSGTLWGWNYGFDCASNKYRLHASHQMIHQQFALLPSRATARLSADQHADTPWRDYTPYGCGDLIREHLRTYEAKAGSNFFDDYEKAIRNNKRMDGREDLPASLIIYEDSNVLLFVPKAQTSQWELQLMAANAGNIIEADSETRNSINKALLIAIRTLAALGAEMVSTIEFSKRIQDSSNQRLLYSFLPKLPFSPGAFSEAQLRWISGHYPEDFARACREKLIL